ncbi:MAG: hypothetical protein JXA22_06845 [Candidatus Thermoplasmatota archaeon]|nr:hypothetical protein [Candidatus Thermoplasmatota archaeon]
MDVMAALEGIFRSRGYRVIRSSGENRYLLLEKEGNLMGVGHSISGGKLTEGEAEMFISMCQNDSAGSMLFISPSRLPSVARYLFEGEGVETWDRATFSTAVGELVISGWELTEPVKDGSPLRDQLQIERTDVDKGSGTLPKGTVSTEMGGFKVREIEIGGGHVIDNAAPAPIDKQGPRTDREQGISSAEETSDIELAPIEMPHFDDEPDIKTSFPQKVAEKGSSDHPRKVPEQILLDPWTVDDARVPMEELAGPELEEFKVPAKKKITEIENPWVGSTIATLKYTEKDAFSLAGEEEGDGLTRENRPFLLLEASYMMVPEDGTAQVEQDSTYLYDCLRSEVFDIPGSLYDDMAEMTERWDGSHGPDNLKNPRDDHNLAMTALRERIAGDQMAKDRKVRETLMSTIYREINYGFDPGSLKLISSRRVMLPFWVKKRANGESEWEVNGFLGHFSK